MRTLTLTLFALLFLTACDKVRPPKTLDRDGIRLTRTEVDLALAGATMSQVEGTLLVLAREGWSFAKVPIKAYELQLQDNAFVVATTWPEKLKPRTLTKPGAGITVKRPPPQSKSLFAEAVVQMQASNGASEQRALPKNQVLSNSALLDFASGMFAMHRDRRSGVQTVAFIPADGEEGAKQEFSDVSALLYGFEDGNLTAIFVLKDGSVLQLDPELGTVGPGDLTAAAVTWLKSATRPGGTGAVDGAFAGNLIATRTAKGIEVFNGEKVVTLETWDAFMTRPSGQPRSENMANYLVEHPEDLAAEGRQLRLDVHNASARVRPFDEDTLAIFDDDYNRIVLLELAQ